MTNAEARFNKSYIRKVYACLAVTCHLHFWQNDRDFLRATVVICVQIIKATFCPRLLGDHSSLTRLAGWPLPWCPRTVGFTCKTTEENNSAVHSICTESFP